VDLSLLPHLSDSALREEAARRGIDAAGLDREALIAAIRGAARAEPREAAPGGSRRRTDRGGAVSGEGLRRAAGLAGDASAVAGPRAPVDPLAATVPPAPPEAEPPARAFGAARALLGRVVSMARTALDRREEAPRAAAAPPSSSEPIATRTMAELLIRQGHLERARSILRELAADGGDAEVAALLADVEGRLADDALRDLAESRLRIAKEPFVALLDVPHGRGLVWRLDEADLGRGRALLGANGVLTLRVVQIVAHPDHSVESRREDRRPLEPAGWTRLDAPEGARLVASVGLSEGERFVSVLHTAG